MIECGVQGVSLSSVEYACLLLPPLTGWVCVLPFDC